MPLCCPDNSETLSGCFRNQCPDATEIRNKLYSIQQLNTHYLKGGLFERLILTELAKYRYNKGLEPHIYFWRDNKGSEVDCILEHQSSLIPVEIKAGKTISNAINSLKSLLSIVAPQILLSADFFQRSRIIPRVNLINVSFIRQLHFILYICLLYKTNI